MIVCLLFVIFGEILKTSLPSKINLRCSLNHRHFDELRKRFKV